MVDNVGLFGKDQLLLADGAALRRSLAPVVFEVLLVGGEELLLEMVGRQVFQNPHAVAGQHLQAARALDQVPGRHLAQGGRGSGRRHRGRCRRSRRRPAGLFGTGLTGHRLVGSSSAGDIRGIGGGRDLQPPDLQDPLQEPQQVFLVDILLAQVGRAQVDELQGVPQHLEVHLRNDHYVATEGVDGPALGHDVEEKFRVPLQNVVVCAHGAAVGAPAGRETVPKSKFFFVFKYGFGSAPENDPSRRSFHRPSLLITPNRK